MADPSIFPLFIACSILQQILTTSFQSSNVVVVVLGMLETFQYLGNPGSARELKRVESHIVKIGKETDESTTFSVSSLILHSQCNKQPLLRFNADTGRGKLWTI